MREIKDTENRRPLPDAEADGIIEGRNAVIEALRTETAIDKIYIAKGETDKTLGHIASKARAAGIVVVDAARRKLDAMSRTHAHQGVIALSAADCRICSTVAYSRTAARAMTPWWAWVRLMASSFRRSASTTTTPASRAREAIWPRVLSVSPLAR